MSPRPARVTSGDVARHAGLSRSAVSQILNGNEDRFPPETRARVLAAAAELNYRPSRAGRALVTGVNELVVLVVPNVTFGHLLQDAVDRLSTYGPSVVVRYSGTDAQATLSAVLDLQPSTVIDMGVFDAAAEATLHAAGIRVLPDSETRAALDATNTFIGELQAEHLLARPGRRLYCAMLVDERLDPYGPSRAEGVRRYARRTGAPDPVVLHVPMNRRGATEELRAHLGYAPEPLGVACYNDDVAIAVLAAARELDLAVPDRLAVVGVDHTAIGQLVAPRLTTVRVDSAGMLTRILDRAVGGPIDLTAMVGLVPGESA